MAANKIKFEMTLKELTFKYEGDFEHGQRLQLGINRALNDLGKLQNAAAGLEDVKEAKVIESPSSVIKTFRRRRRKSSEEGEAKNDDSQTVEKADTPAERTGSGESPTALVIELRKENFFQVGKTLGQVVSELNRRGHVYQTV